MTDLVHPVLTGGEMAMNNVLGKQTCTVVVTGAILLACGTNSSEFDENGRPASDVYSQRFAETAPTDLYANDPPAEWCGPAKATPPPPVGGTEYCPSDKNKPGCPCNALGETATCWTGLRRHRNLGICRDGKTTCGRGTEVQNVWGPCEDEVLPKPGAIGPEGCGCFSVGEWKVANTAPCMRSEGAIVGAMSTVYQTGPSTNCGLNDSPIPPLGTAPPGAWSPSTLKVDCAGKFDLCFRIRAGDYANPKESDCILGESCTNADYATPNVEQALPDLPTWAGKDNACAKKWEVDTPSDKSPGYAEMIVKGHTLACDNVDDGAGKPFVFHRIQYCPRICRGGANATHPACVACKLAGRGTF